MNWLADLGNSAAALLAPSDVPASSKDAGDSGITVFASGVPASSSNDDEIEALAESQLAALSLGDLGDTGDRDGYLEEVRKLLFQPSKVSQFVGMDVTSLLSVPLFIMEPFSMLQKMAEIMEYTQLLEQADAADDPIERLALVAAFLVSPFGAAERTWKPFNPVLGETFELSRASGGVTFLAEQVSHHPPVSAAHAESDAFAYDIVSAPSTKFLGNSLEVYPKGRTRITLKRSGQLFSHVPPAAKVHNLVLGRTWIDSYGPFHVANVTTGDRVELEFKACGWFGGGQYEFDGHVLDAQGNARAILSGRWNSHVDMAPCNPDGSALSPPPPPRRLWSCAAKPEDDAYGCTHFALALNSTVHCGRPPLRSDSRRRGDRQALQERRMAAAAAEKAAIEEQQRQEKKLREEAGAEWRPRWFEPAPDMQVLPGEEPSDVVPLWRWNGQFSEAAAPAATPSWQDEVMGQGFAPWQFLDASKQPRSPTKATAAAGAAGAKQPGSPSKAAGSKPE